MSTLGDLQPGDMFRLNQRYRDGMSRPAYSCGLRDSKRFNFDADLTVFGARDEAVLCTDDADNYAWLHSGLRIRTD